VYAEAPIKEYGPADQIFTPDDILAGRLPGGPTIIFDDDHYYMASDMNHLPGLSSSHLISYIVIRYPGYLDDFEALKKIAPEEDVTTLFILTDHEMAAIKFAGKELVGKTDSLTLLHEYLHR
jgi:hypothetical protein